MPLLRLLLPIAYCLMMIASSSPISGAAEPQTIHFLHYTKDSQNCKALF
jgi:hypothetical protein